MLNYDALKSIPISSVLESYGVKVIGSGIQLKAECPIPSHPKDSDKHGTLSFNTEKRKFRCHDTRCLGNRGGDVLDLVRLVEGLDMKGACKRLLEMNGNGAESKHSDVVPLPTTKQVIGNKPLGFVLKGIQYEHPLIQGKGISAGTAEEYGIGFFPGKGSMQGRIVFPLWERFDTCEPGCPCGGNLELVGYAGRAVTDDLKPKWLLPKNFTKFCYGLDLFCDPSEMVIVGESFWLPAFMHERGFQACSLMGCELTERMERELEPYNNLIIAMDSDPVGIEARNKIAARLRAKGHSVIKSSLLE